MIIDGNNNNFDIEISNGIVLVDFNASWCGPCRMLRPILDDVIKEKPDSKIISVNVDNNEQLASRYNIFSIPCLILFKDGKEANRTVGLKSKEEIIKLLEEV